MDRSITFDRALYLPEAVQAAVEAYKAYCTIDVDTSPTEITVHLRGYDPGYGADFGDAFANHVLFETVVRSRELLAGVPV